MANTNSLKTEAGPSDTYNSKILETYTEQSDKNEASANPITNNLQFCLLILSLFCGTFVMALDATIIGTAIPSITSEFNSLDDIAWYGSGYLLTITALQPTLGRLYRFANIKVIFMTCVVIFEGKSLALSNNTHRIDKGSRLIELPCY